MTCFRLLCAFCFVVCTYRRDLCDLFACFSTYLTFSCVFWVAPNRSDHSNVVKPTEASSAAHAMPMNSTCTVSAVGAGAAPFAPHGPATKTDQRTDSARTSGKMDTYRRGSYGQT